MNAKIFTLLLVGLLGGAGCTTWRYQLTPPIAGGPPIILPEVRPSASLSDTLRRAAAQPAAPFEAADWVELFDGRSLTGWQVTDFGQSGGVTITNGLLVILRGAPFAGVNGLNPPPAANYELAFDAMRLEGEDFFCGLTFPVRDSHCSLIVGGWGGGLVGLSSIDGADASENETSTYVSFESGRWYRIRLRVTEHTIEAWVEQKKVVNLNIVGRQLNVRFGEILQSRPFGLATWSTSAAFRHLKWRAVSEPEFRRLKDLY